MLARGEELFECVLELLDATRQKCDSVTLIKYGFEVDLFLRAKSHKFVFSFGKLFAKLGELEIARSLHARDLGFVGLGCALFWSELEKLGVWSYSEHKRRIELRVGCVVVGFRDLKKLLCLEIAKMDRLLCLTN